MNVLKFGGTSMGDENTWRRVLDIINGYETPVVVVSATAHTTRQLLAAADKALENLEQARQISHSIKNRHHQLIDQFLNDSHHPQKADIQQSCTNRINKIIEILDKRLQDIASTKKISPKNKDAIASLGEQLSAYLLARCGKAYGLKTRWVDVRQIIKTDSNFGQANPDFQQITQSINLLHKEIKHGTVPVLGGFYGENYKGEITTLGFEGSDYTASLLGAALQAKAIEIWTDVSGIYTCDPNVVQHSRPISQLSFQEATEMAYFGAKVLHPCTMKPAAAADIPIIVKNIFEADHPGTKIHNQQTRNGWAKAITYLSDITILTITSNGSMKGYQFLAQVFKRLHENGISVNAVTTTEASVSVALQANFNMQILQQDFEDIGSVNRNPTQGLISLIGCRFDTAESINQYIFSAIPEAKPSLISYSKTKQNLCIAVSETELIPAVCRIHDSLFGEGG